MLEVFLDYPIQYLRKDLGLSRCVPNNDIALHIRGGDFYHWKSHSIVSVDWYICCLQSLGRPIEIVHIYTDDQNDPRVIALFDFLNSNNIHYVVDTSSTLSSWFKLFNTGLVIASPSTFSISAGVLGENKVILSKNYVNVEKETSEFWKAVSLGKFKNIKLV